MIIRVRVVGDCGETG